jgi:phage-related protein
MVYSILCESSCNLFLGFILYPLKTALQVIQYPLTHVQSVLAILWEIFVICRSLRYLWHISQSVGRQLLTNLPMVANNLSNIGSEFFKNLYTFILGAFEQRWLIPNILRKISTKTENFFRGRRSPSRQIIIKKVKYHVPIYICTLRKCKYM